MRVKTGPLAGKWGRVSHLPWEIGFFYTKFGLESDNFDSEPRNSTQGWEIEEMKLYGQGKSYLLFHYNVIVLPMTLYPGLIFGVRTRPWLYYYIYL